MSLLSIFSPYKHSVYDYLDILHENRVFLYSLFKKCRLFLQAPQKSSSLYLSPRPRVASTFSSISSMAAPPLLSTNCLSPFRLLFFSPICWLAAEAPAKNLETQGDQRATGWEWQRLISLAPWMMAWCSDIITPPPPDSDLYMSENWLLFAQSHKYFLLLKQLVLHWK